MRVADFFCGGGGFSEGFRQAGFEIVFAVDKWEPAVTTYRGNKPGVNVHLGDVITISELPDDQFEEMVPDSEVIIGSPPCQAFSHSNKSGSADKTLGIKLIEAYLRIVARKKMKPNSVLRYWVLENVPAVKDFIKEEYTAADLGLEGDFVLHPRDGNSGEYNAKYFGAPTNRKRYLCGEFPVLVKTHTDETAVTLRQVLESLGEPTEVEGEIEDINYPGLVLDREDVSDRQYVHELAPFEWEVARRLKQDKGYMGKMSFPENLDRPSRTVMATMSASSREAMVLAYGEGRYRLPTVRETASMMSFPIDYRFYGISRGIKHTLVGNAVPPKLSYAIAKAIALDAGEPIPDAYIPIRHDPEVDFYDLNGEVYELNIEKPRRKDAKFKYHIPYLIYSAYRVELTNYHSDFKQQSYEWDAEIHYSQGKDKARTYSPSITKNFFTKDAFKIIDTYIRDTLKSMPTTNKYFQKLYCMTTDQRRTVNKLGPYELLDSIRKFIDDNITEENQKEMVEVKSPTMQLPYAIIVGYYILSRLVNGMH